MARTTGIVLATGALTVANQSIFHNQPIDWRVPIATGMAAMGFALMERASPQVAVMVAWTGLIAVMFTRIDPKTPSPVESLMTWWESAGK